MHLLSLFSLRNRALIALVTIVIGVFGGIALTTLKQELIPSLTLPRLVVVTSYPGAAPAVVESDVSTPIETAIQGIEGLESTTATSRANISTVSASFAYGTDITNLEQKVQLAVNRASLPDEVDPRIITGSIEDLPVIQIAVTSDLDERELSSRLDDLLVKIESLEGVREAALLGTSTDRIEITPDVEALAANELTTNDIEDALDANGVLLPAGEITEGGQTLVVQAGNRVDALQQLRAIPLLSGTPGQVVALSDVADVQIVAEPATGISRVNGEPALTISVTKTPDGNTVAVSELVRELIPELEDSVGNNSEFTIVFDQAPFIERSIEALTTEGLLGLFFAIIVILVFLLSLRSTLVTAISIPASILVTFIGMLASGYTLNIITLGALTISVGRVVDDSIVVIENIKRHIELGDEKWVAITTAVREVAGAITASTVTTIAVFLPLALVSDITGELFRPFALTVSIALAASLLVSLTIVPVLAYWFLGRRKGKAAAKPAVQSHEDELATPTFLQRGYLPIIRWTLRRPVAVLLAAVLVLGGTGLLATGLKTNFIGDSGQNTITVRQQLPLGTSLEARDEAASEVEEVLQRLDGIEIVQLSIGSSGSPFSSFAVGGSGNNTFSLTTDPEVDQVELQAQVRVELDELDGVGEFSLSAAGGGFASSDIAVNVRASTESELREATDAISAAIRDLGVVAEFSSNLSEEQPYIGVVVDREAAAEAGLSEIAVGGLVARAMNPTPSGSVVIDETTLSIYIENENKPLTIEELRDFQIPTALGPVELTELADVEELNGPASITTSRGVRSATITITPGSDDIGTASAEVEAALADADLPPGASAELGGVTSQQSEAFEQLGLALLISILIVYIVMVATFRSLRQPLLLLVSVPFAATGAIALQLITGIPLGAASLIGVIMLVGIVVTNAIVLIDLVNQYRERGLRVDDAILHGAARRLRPILMTAAATIFALVPLAMGITGQGGFISQPLAVVVIGGLVSSTILTLIVLPVLYYLVEGAKERREVRRAVRVE